MPKKLTYEELEARVREYELAEPARKRLEQEQQVFLEVLQVINGTESLQDLLCAILDRLKQWPGCEAVGLRLKDGPDFPYFVTSGFPDWFVKLGKHLCSYEEDGEVTRDKDGKPLLECMCGNILCGRFDPAKDFFTSDGSFWSNCTTELLATTTDADRQARTRNRCNGAGCESVALIPLRSAGETFGLIQLNDHRRGRFSPELIAGYRRIAPAPVNRGKPVWERACSRKKAADFLPLVLFSFCRTDSHIPGPAHYIQRRDGSVSY